MYGVLKLLLSFTETTFEVKAGGRCLTTQRGNTTTSYTEQRQPRGQHVCVCVANPSSKAASGGISDDHRLRAFESSACLESLLSPTTLFMITRQLRHPCCPLRVAPLMLETCCSLAV